MIKAKHKCTVMLH